MSDEQTALNSMAEEIFDLTTLASIRRARSRSSRSGEVSESEFLTLDILAKHQPVTIGEIQKRIGVVPAQMSRIVKGLEDRTPKSYIHCSINAKDRRRIDVAITPEGRSAYEKYRSTRLSSTLDTLSALSPKDLNDFMRVLRKIKQRISDNLDAGA